MWLGHTGDDGRSADDDLAVVQDFIAHAGREATSGPRPLDDRRPLLAIPLVGTGSGGRAGVKGEVVKAVREAAADDRVRDVLRRAVEDALRPFGGQASE